jgi:hypothetical protein
MSTSPVTQIDPSSVDTVGLSVAIATPTSSNPRYGLAYDPVIWAAAAPIWCHQLFGGSWLVCCAQRWYATTPDGGTPGAYATHSTDTLPSWMVVQTPTGQRSAVPGQPVDIPMTTVATNQLLVAGASVPPNLLFLLSSATVAGTSTAVLQRFHVSINGAVALAAEDTLPVAYFWQKSTDHSITITTSASAPPVTPPGAYTWTLANTVVFNKGLQISGNNLMVYGTDSEHRVYKVTKPWGQVGVNKTITVTIIKNTEPNLITPQGWQYFTGTGYSPTATDLAPMTVAGGAPLTTIAPLSFGSFSNQVLMASVGTGGAQFWTSKSGMPFTPTGALVALPSGTPIGGVQLQNNLAPNPADAVMTAPGVISGVPYVVSASDSISGGATLNTDWNILAVTS